MITLKTIKLAWPTKNLKLTSFFANLKGVKQQRFSGIANQFFILVLILLGCNLSVA